MNGWIFYSEKKDKIVAIERFYSLHEKRFHNLYFLHDGTRYVILDDEDLDEYLLSMHEDDWERVGDL